MTDDRAFTEQFDVLSDINMNPAEYEEVWENVLHGIRAEKPQGSLMPRKNISRTSMVVTAATVALVAVGGTLAYKTVTSPSASQKRTTTEPSSKVKNYYRKTLGFQPMLPSYIPTGLTIRDLTVDISDISGQHTSAFQLDLSKQGYDDIYIAEMPLLEFQATQGQNSETKQRTMTKKTIKAGGLTITESGYKPNTVLMFSKDGVEYRLNYTETSVNHYSTNELVKILESLTVSEEKQPNHIIRYGAGTMLGAQWAANFKVKTPAFIPSGFSLSHSQGDLFARTVLTSPDDFSTVSAAAKRTSTSKGAASFFQATYVNKDTRGSIRVFESQDRNNLASPQFPKVSTFFETIKGHQILVQETKAPSGSGSYTMYSYQWENPATDIYFSVTGSDDVNPRVIDKTTMDKVVASILGQS